MLAAGKTRSRLKVGAAVLVVLGILAVAALVAIRLASGRGTGLKSLPRNILSLVRSNLGQDQVTANNRGEFTNIIFLHHSTGNNLIERGGVRELFTQAGYDFWDHGYNYQGLRDPSGAYTGYSYVVPRDNTDPDGLANIFSQRLYERPMNTLSGLFQHEVIVFKPCFAPANMISSAEQLDQYKKWYLGMLPVMTEHHEKLFVVLTIPPLNPVETNPEQAARARAFANWLKSDEFLSGIPNITTYDFFDALAEGDLSRPDAHMLREAYRNGADSHPNRLANQTLGPEFVKFITQAIENYRETLQ